MARTRRFAMPLLLAAIALSGCSGPKENGGAAPPAGAGGAGTETSAAPASGSKMVGVSLSSRNHNFFLGMEQGVTEELKAQGLESEIVVADDSASTQQQQVDTFIRKGVGAIIMVPVDAQQAITPVEAANKAGIPIFCIDRRITDPNAKVTATVETDNKAMGEDAGKYALKLLCDRRKISPDDPEAVKAIKTKVIHLWGFESASSAQDRAEGFERVINKEKTPGIEVIKAVGNFNSKTAQEQAAPILRANPDVELIYCHGDDNAMGALNAIKDIKGKREAPGDPKRILIVSIDGNRDALAAIRSGDLEATITQEPILMGQETVRQVKKVLDGGQPDAEYIPIKHALITKKEADAMQGQLWADQLKNAK